MRSALGVYSIAKLFSRHVNSKYEVARTHAFVRMVHDVDNCGSELAQSSNKELIVYPPVRKGMTELDKEAFRKKIPVPTITVNVEDKLKSKEVFEVLKPYLLKLKALKAFRETEDKKRLVYLNPDLVGGTGTDKLQEFLERLRTESPVAGAFQDISTEEVELNYDHWSADQILDSVLPDDAEKVAGFSKAGHLLHLNLREHLLPYKKIIGQVLLEKISSTKTVVNKLNIIDSTYRNFEMEILAGEPDTLVTVKHVGCVFRFDFAKVYWNTRLTTEHERILKFLSREDTLYDVFAGVGPFAVPAGKRNIRVLANDLNPESYKWMKLNIEKNRCADFVTPYNLDGKEFVHAIVKEDLKKNYKEFKQFHVVMNLPALAVEFLQSFWNVLEDCDVAGENTRVVVHVYCFVKDHESKDFKTGALNLVKKKLGYELDDKDVIEVFSVRIVAPNKEMIRVSFRLPLAVAKKNVDGFGEASAKKIKLDGM